MSDKKLNNSEGQLLELFREIIFCHYHLVSLGKELGAITDAGIPTWNLLKSLLQAPMTVPELASERSVSRQYIQKNVNKLIEQGLIRKTKNKQHQRSYLIEITEEGRIKYQHLNDHLLQKVGAIAKGAKRSDLKACQETIGVISQSIQSHLSS